MRAHARRHRRGHYRRARLCDARLRCRRLCGRGGQLLVTRAARLASIIYLTPTLTPTTLIPTTLTLTLLRRRVSPTLAKASMYIFLDAAVQPHSLVIYKWCKATPDNCDAARHAQPRPCFTPEFIGGHPAHSGDAA